MNQPILSDVIANSIIISLVILIIYKFSRQYYYIRKWKKCPKCGGEVYHNTIEHYTYSDQETFEEFYCKDCDWKDKFKH